MTDGDASGAATGRPFLGGRVVLSQPDRGHRAGTDAVLLAAAGPSGVAGAVVDLGSGVGSVGIAFATRSPGASLRLVEIDPALAGLATTNLAHNGMSGRGRVVVADALAPLAARREAGIAGGDADLVLTNPPFDSAARGRPSPDPGRRLAHVMEDGGFSRWFAAAADALVHRGVLIAIVRADALGDVVAALSPRFGGLALLPVHPRRDAPAKRLIVRAVKGSRGPLALLPGLVLHAGVGVFTPEADALHRGEADLAAVCPGW